MNMLESVTELAPHMTHTLKQHWQTTHQTNMSHAQHVIMSVAPGISPVHLVSGQTGQMYASFWCQH